MNLRDFKNLSYNDRVRIAIGRHNGKRGEFITFHPQGYAIVGFNNRKWSTLFEPKEITKVRRTHEQTKMVMSNQI